MRKRTLVTHPPDVKVPADNRPLVAPIYQSVKFTFDDVGATLEQFKGKRAGFYYSRVSNPTLRQLELLLAELQGRDACLLTGSGVAAIAMPLIALLKSGDHVVHFAEQYQPTRALIGRVLRRFGVASTMLSIDDLEGLERVLAATPTRLVVFESPTNPALKIADIERLTASARRHGALTLLDNTLAGLHNHGQFDVDLFAHSLTKYASGHGDVMGGAVIGRAELIDSMRDDVSILGPTLDPHAAFLLQRGMKTYFVRWDAQCRNALRVAKHLAQHPRVERVRYPGLPGDPGHDLALRQMPDFGTIVTIDVAGGEEVGSRFAEQLKLFSIAASLGSTESLVVPPALQKVRGFTAEQQRWADIGPGTVRLSIGLEDVDDLTADLDSALGQPELD
ncbi:MAG: aminotransferase class I/II-fold pyridoxal phosphate-dependent enzyme [Steroidobacteraceae bacterium]|nr:aminotransferase class I/II-fold pyridoxal phosphate-dependent enzyme [Steroidobacteraceae bacterium]MBP9128781.1 aminotransferase class I/II-fold pyridoxal phosphate-dependent enzyme [Steroidobacteraceae bacterium]